MIVTTLSERKAREAGCRAEAASQVAALLRAYATAHGGRFVLFGSFATGRMRHDSDLDVLVDFGQAESAAAWRFVEEICRQAGIEADIHDAATSKAPFVARARADGLVLP
jgi:predicted nucleotidyltransferase